MSGAVEQAMADGARAFAAGRFLDAAQHYGAVIAADPTNAKAFSNRSAAFASAQRYDEALADAEKCVALDPSFSKGHGRLATALQGLKRYEDAALAFEKALALDPSNESYKSGLTSVRTLAASGQGIASEATRRTYYLEQALQKGKEAMERGFPSEAVRHYTKALSLCDSKDKHVLLANRSAAHFNVGDFLDSIDDAKASAAAAPAPYARAHLRMAMALAKLGRTSEAEAAARQSLSINPKCDKSAVLLNELAAAKTAPPPPPAEVPKQPELSMPAAASNITIASSHKTSYSYCKYCNKNGHTRATCPLRLAKQQP